MAKGTRPTWPNLTQIVSPEDQPDPTWNQLGPWGPTWLVMGFKLCSFGFIRYIIRLSPNLNPQPDQSIFQTWDLTQNLVQPGWLTPWKFGMENSRGQWIVVDTFFQNGQIIVDIFRGWIFMEIFWVNSSGHFLMVITNSANTVSQPTQGVRGQSPC